MTSIVPTPHHSDTACGLKLDPPPPTIPPTHMPQTQQQTNAQRSRNEATLLPDLPPHPSSFHNDRKPPLNSNHMSPVTWFPSSSFVLTIVSFYLPNIRERHALT